MVQRPARPDDAAALAELVNMAGEGMPLDSWTRMAPPGVSPWAVGQARARREEGSFSFRHAWVRQVDDRVVASLVGYPLPEDVEPSEHLELPARFRPLQQLEDLACGTWYVNVLATYPEFRGQGHGRALLELAETLARAASRGGMSIIVSDGNKGARRLYERHGYRKIDARPVVEDGLSIEGAEWLLLTRSLD